MPRKSNPRSWSFSGRLWLLIIMTVTAVIVVYMLRPVSQPAVYHLFADRRSLWGIPNFLNVITNLPFLVTGSAGLYWVSRGGGDDRLRVIYIVLFAGILLTAAGSCYYHLMPSNDTLVYDRIPMTIVFMSLLSAIIARRIEPRMANVLLAMLVSAGIGSVWWWHLTETQGSGDLRAYILVQYYPVLCIPMVMLLFPFQMDGRLWRAFGLALGWYAIAKFFDVYDHEIYQYTGVLSGHSLKHLAAAVSTWYLKSLLK